MRASVVMPGHIGTDIAINSSKLHGNDPMTMSTEQLQGARARISEAGLPVDSVTDDALRDLMRAGGEAFRDMAPMTAAEASAFILASVQRGEWRILVGDDAVILDEMVRENPTSAYLPDFHEKVQARGALGGIGR